MRFTINRDMLLKPLQQVCGVVERRQTLPILSHVLLSLKNEVLTIKATDLEVEMVALTPLKIADQGETTLPARKFLDICRALPESADIKISVEKTKAILQAGKSRFTLAVLPANEFPTIDVDQDALTFSMAQKDLKHLIEKTHFAMAQQDVRYYLNGLMLELSDKRIRAVATDGHRLAMSDAKVDLSSPEVQQVIVPRKGIQELLRLLEDSEDTASIKVGNNHATVEMGDITFISKLIDGRFPDYQRVLPAGGDKFLVSNREELKQAFTRTSILSNEKYRGIRLQMAGNQLRVMANNPEQEEAEEELDIEYTGDDLEIGFNVSYMIDAISAIETEKVKILFTDANSSCLIHAVDNEDSQYVVMPMRI